MLAKLKSINWKVRKQHILFWIGILGIIGNTVLPYYGLAASDLTEWSTLWEVFVNVIDNPFLLGSIVFSIGASLLGVVTDHTTAGLADSSSAQGYICPKKSSCGDAAS